MPFDGETLEDKLEELEEKLKELEENDRNRSELNENIFVLGFFVSLVYLPGLVLSMILSYTSNHSIWWAILHGYFSWLYIIYKYFS